jgi:hypothetical protein
MSVFARLSSLDVRRCRMLVLVAALALALVLPVQTALALSPSGVAAPEFVKRAGSYSVYLGVLPGQFAEAASGVAPGSGTRGSAADTHLVVVSITDAGRRKLEHVRVEARVAALGFSGERKFLEPLTISSSPAYGATFRMQGRGPFRVDVRFRVPGEPEDGRVRFYFVHPRFRPPPAASP